MAPRLPRRLAAALGATLIQTGEVGDASALLWARCAAPDVEARVALEGEDLAPAPARASGLAPDRPYVWTATCPGEAPARGRFRTAPAADSTREVSFVWLADVAGQGWGRNPDLEVKPLEGEPIRGGFVGFETVRRLAPDFAILQGDTIYADVPVPAEKPIPPEVGGGTWRNAPAKDFVARDLDALRAAWRYTLEDEHARRLLAEVPVYAQWDDHEVEDDWSPGDSAERDALIERARSAFREFTPLGDGPVYRRFRRGRHLEVFLLDTRSHRAPNARSDDPAGAAMLGAEQLGWLKRGLAESTATWKLVSSGDPLSIPTGAPGRRDGWAQGDARALGRELEAAELFAFLRERSVHNVIFLGSDVHYSAVIAYDPARAPLQEWVVGPIHAGAFGPAELDPSFGARYEFVHAPGAHAPPLPMNLPPPNFSAFGHARVSADGRLTLSIRDLRGAALVERTLAPE
jgi:alkaline phosphatase D